MEPQALFENGSQVILVHGRVRRAVRDAPEILVAYFLARTVELDKPARPEQLDAFDRGIRADHKAIPGTACGGLWVELRRAEQSGSQQRPQLRGEGDRPICA